MAARAYWSGQIRLALVSIPVEVYPATWSAGAIGFNLIHRPSGERDAIDVLLYEKPCFVVPADDLAEEAYVVLREALKASRKVGIGQIAVRGCEQLVALKPCGKGLVLELLRYADEVQQAHGMFADLPTGRPAGPSPRCSTSPPA